MPEISSIHVSLEATVNLGDYQNFKPHVEITAMVLDGETVHGALSDVQAVARRALAREIRRLVENQITDERFKYQDERGIRRQAQWLKGFSYLEMLDESESENVLNDLVVRYAPTNTEAIAASEPDEVPDRDEDDEEDTWDDFGDDDAESDYTGDGFTEEHDDGYPADADPDEVEYEKVRATYPDLPPYAEVAEAEELPFAAEGEDGEPAH